MGTISSRNDTYTNESAPTTAYETEPDMHIYSSSGANKRAYIEFSLTDLPRPYCNLTTLDLYLFTDAWGTPDATLDYNWLSDYNWDDSAVTWNNPPSTGMTDFSLESYVTDVQQDLLDHIEYLNMYYSYIGYEIKYDAEDDSGFIEYRTKEYVSSQYRPYINYECSDWTTQITSDVLNYNPAFETAPWWKGHAKEVYYTDHDVGYDEFELKVLFPWDAFGGEHTTISALPYQTWSSTYSSGSLRWRVYIYFATSGDAPTMRIYEQYWTIGDLYVKTTGDDSLDGRSWDNAWKTINQAANETTDGQEVHIGFGTYNAEPANNDITPVNFGTSGIKYTPETADTGGGTGSVTVEKN